MNAPRQRWYQGVSRYQWLVVLIASAGWVFDAFEGQLFNVQRDQMLAEILKVPQSHPEVRRWGDYFLGVFLLGGTVGGIGFGWLGDRVGRNPAMALSILCYSVFSGLTYFATELWHIGVLRFLVAMGVGGEWAVAAALVAETVPAHARANMGVLFHATSIFGTFLAAWVGLLTPHWRIAFLISVAPALLVFCVRWKLKESALWLQAKHQSANTPGGQLGSFRELLLTRSPWRRHALVGTCFAAVGLGTFWAITVAGQDLAKDMLVRQGTSTDEATARAKFAYGNIQVLGAGVGMLAFGPLAARFGRKSAFVFYHLGSLCVVPFACFAPRSYEQLLLILPFYGFFTLGIHAGYAVYFPELFPHRLRSTGAGFCFNGGRLLASSALVFSGWIKSFPGISLQIALSSMALIFLLGLVCLSFLPETRDQSLPE